MVPASRSRAPHLISSRLVSSLVGLLLSLASSGAGFPRATSDYQGLTDLQIYQGVGVVWACLFAWGERQKKKWWSSHPIVRYSTVHATACIQSVLCRADAVRALQVPLPARDSNVVVDVDVEVVMTRNLCIDRSGRQEDCAIETTCSQCLLLWCL